MESPSQQSSLLLTITIDLIEEKKQSKWTFWATEGTVKEKWIYNIIVEKKGSRTSAEVRQDVRTVIVDTAKECLKHCDHLSEGYPNNLSVSYKLARN